MKYLLAQAQQDTAAAVDTLTRAYSQKWDAAKEIGNANPLIKATASHDLIFVVLAVSLIIWFVLLFFIVRVDRKVGKLEKQIESQKSTQES